MTDGRTLDTVTFMIMTIKLRGPASRKPSCPREAQLPRPILRELLAATTMAMTTAMTSVTDSVTMTTVTNCYHGGRGAGGGRAEGNNEASVRSAQPMVAATTVAMEAWKRWQRRQERKLSCKICVRSRSLQLPSRNQVSRMEPSSTTSISNDE